MAAAPDTILSDHIQLRPNYKLETIANMSDASPKQSATKNRHPRAYIKKQSLIMKSNASVRSWLGIHQFSPRRPFRQSSKWGTKNLGEHMRY